MRPPLDLIMEAVLRELALTSVISAASTRDGARGKPDSVLFNGVYAPHLRHLRHYNRCRTDAQRRECIAEALQELREIRYSRKPKVDCSTLEGRMEVGRDPRPASLVAYVYGYTVRHVRRLRAEAKARDSVPSAKAW